MSVNNDLLRLLILFSVILLYYKGRLLFDLINRLARIIKLNIFGPDKFTPLEEAILSAVREKLTDKMAKLWNKQMSLVNMVDRIVYREVIFRRVKNGEIYNLTESLFPNKKEFCIATVDIFSRKNPSIKLRARVFALNGYVFSIDYVSFSNEFEKKVPPEDWVIKCHIEKQH